MKNKTYQIGIIWANPYNKNLGVAALAYSSLAIFHDIIKENNLNATLTLVGSNESYKGELDINNNKITFKNVKGRDLLKWISIIKLIALPFKYHTRHLMSFDVVFDIAEGDSFTDIYGIPRFKRILNSKRFFTLFGIRQILLPQTIGPFKDSEVEKQAFDAMKKLYKVISRDKKSFDYTQKFLSPDKIMESIDVAFYLPFQRTSYSSDKIHVGLNVSGLLWNGGYTKNNQFDLKSDYPKIITEIMEFFLAQPNVLVHLIPHVVPLDHPVEDDFVASEDLHAKYPSTVLAPRFTSPIEAKSYISGLDFFTGARMHACIAAFSSGVPVVPMAYSRKFNGLFVETLQYPWLADCVNETDAMILENITKAFHARSELKEVIKTSNEQIVAPRLKKLKVELLDAITHD